MPIPTMDQVIEILEARADEAHLADHMPNDYMILHLSEDSLFPGDIILGFMICQVKEGVLLVPFRLSDVDNGYEQFEILDARLADQDDLAYIKDRLASVYNAQSGYLNNIMKKEGDQA
jgi:hypothetical protein